MNTIVATIKHRVLVEGRPFVIWGFGTFQPRYITHGKIVAGNVAQPSVVVVFRPSRLSRMQLESDDT